MSSNTTISAEYQQYLDFTASLDATGYSLSPAMLKQVAASMPPPLIEGLLPSQAVVTFAGPPGIGKSFTALSWAASVAMGQPWFGQAVQSPQFVAYVLGEGFAQFGHRISAWETVHGPLNNNLRFIDGAGQGVDLMNPESVEALVEKLYVFKPRLVILDTFAMLARIKSENDNSQVAAAYRAANRIAISLGATVVIVHHVSKESGLVRGATAFRGNSDTVIVAAESPRENESSFFLSTRGEDDGKQRDGMPIKLEGFEIDPSGVLTCNRKVVENGAARDTLKRLAAEKQAESA